MHSTYSPYGGNQTAPFSYAIAASNAPTSFSASNLPAGLILNPSTGVISGQHLTSGNYQIPITATNAVGTVGATLTLLATATTPTVNSSLCYSGSVGSSFWNIISTNLTSGGAVYYRGYGVFYDRMSLAAAGLPPGLSLNTLTGSVTGVPTQAGTYPVTVTATNRAGTGTAVVMFTIAQTTPPVTAPPAFYNSAMVQSYAGFPFSAILAATDATSYGASGLPAGLSLDSSTGYVTGTPTQVSAFSVPVTATNGAGMTQALLTIVVDAIPPTPIISSAAGARATVGTPFSYAIGTLSAVESPALTAYGASGVPAGLSIDQKTGLITGMPAGPTGTFVIPITAAIGSIVGQGSLTLIVQSAPAVPTVLANTAGALGFLNNPLTYLLGNTGFAPTSQLPAGLSDDVETGSIGGIPSAAGTFRIGLAAAGTSGTAALTLRVLAPELSLPRLTEQPAGATTKRP